MSTEKSLSRRKFIEGAAANAAAVAGASALAGMGVPPAAAKTKCSSNVPAKWDYAADVVVAGTGMGGPRRNKLCQIVDPDKKPIARLYGTGELGSFWGWGYYSGGNIGECLFSGRIAAKHAVALKPWDAGA